MLSFHEKLQFSYPFHFDHFDNILLLVCASVLSFVYWLSSSIFILRIVRYKGYGLGLMVEIFCGILSGSAWGPSVRKWKIQDQVFDLHCQNIRRIDRILCTLSPSQEAKTFDLVQSNTIYNFGAQVANLGQCFVALDPSAFTDSFPERLQVWHICQNLSLADQSILATLIKSLIQLILQRYTVCSPLKSRKQF